MATGQPPLGISRLMALDSVTISQKTTFFESNKYAVLAPDQSLVMYAKEEGRGWGIFRSSSDARGFDMSIVDTQNNEVIRLRRPYTFGADKMDVSMCGQLVSVIRQKLTFMQPVLLVNDAADRPMLKVKGHKMAMGYERDFEVFSGESRIGVITKTWGGARREFFSRADNFLLRFPLDLDVRCKCALVGAAVLLDFLYFEK